MHCWNTVWAPWQQWGDEKCFWTWHVVYSAATSQSPPSPVPDVLFTVHVSTIWTTALSYCQTLSERTWWSLHNIQSHQIKKNKKNRLTLYHTHAGTYTLWYAHIHAQMHMRWYKWDFSMGRTLEHEHNHLFLAGFVLSLFSWFIFIAMHHPINAYAVYLKHAAHMGQMKETKESTVL